MSFNELDKKIGETQKSIDTLNAKKVKVEADNAQLKELKDLLDKLNGAVNTKTTSLNTEKGISDRIKQLKNCVKLPLSVALTIRVMIRK
ncbi:hypothetical protein SFC43_18300 [Bacteroides sp. CR5/BHMF/2]|nr:hypothetical protein [Bacteroides sp. CR5/BHMF/2]